MNIPEDLFVVYKRALPVFNVVTLTELRILPGVSGKELAQCDTQGAISATRRVFSVFKGNEAMYGVKLQEIFTQNQSKYYSAAKYRDNLNQVQSYLSVKIKKSRPAAESRPLCLKLFKNHRFFSRFKDFFFRCKIFENVLQPENDDLNKRESGRLQIKRLKSDKIICQYRPDKSLFVSVA